MPTKVNGASGYSGESGQSGSSGYRIDQDKSGIKIGDFVKITRVSQHGENKWPFCWVKSMDGCVGHTYRVSAIDSYKGILLEGSRIPSMSADPLVSIFRFRKTRRNSTWFKARS